MLILESTANNTKEEVIKLKKNNLQNFTKFTKNRKYRNMDLTTLTSERLSLRDPELVQWHF